MVVVVSTRRLRRQEAHSDSALWRARIISWTSVRITLLSPAEFSPPSPSFRRRARRVGRPAGRRNKFNRALHFEAGVNCICAVVFYRMTAGVEIRPNLIIGDVLCLWRLVPPRFCRRVADFPLFSGQFPLIRSHRRRPVAHC